MNSDKDQSNQNPSENPDQDQFDNESNWSDVRSRASEDEFIFLDDDEIHRIEDEIFDEDDENDEEESKNQDGDQSTIVKSNPIDNPKAKFNYHRDSVYSLALSSANKSIFASGGGDDLAVVWTFENSENPVLNTLVGHADTIDKLAFSSDSKLLATAALDGEIVVWDPISGQKKFNLDGPTADISFIEWHSKGSAVVAGSADNSVWLWNGSNGTYFNSFQGHLGPVTCGGWSPDGKQIISASEDASLRVWNPKTAECVFNVKGHGFHTGPIFCLAFSHASPIVATGSVDKTVCISNINTGKILARTMEHGDSVEGVVLPNNFDVFATCSLDTHVRIFDIHRYSLKEKWSIESGLNRIAHYAEKSLFVTSSIDGKMFLFDHRSSEPVAKIHCHASCIEDFKILPSNEILSADDDGKIYLYDVRTQKEAAILANQRQQQQAIEDSIANQQSHETESKHRDEIIDKKPVRNDEKNEPNMKSQDETKIDPSSQSKENLESTSQNKTEASSQKGEDAKEEVKSDQN